MEPTNKVILIRKREIYINDVIVICSDHEDINLTSNSDEIRVLLTLSNLKNLILKKKMKRKNN